MDSMEKKDKFNYIVARDGSGDFAKIQQAIDASPSFPRERISIFVKDGVYTEKIKIPEWNTKLSLVGESRDKAIITFDDHFNKMQRGRNSTFFTPTLSVDADECTLKNLTIINSAGDIGQAIALAVGGDGVMIENCNLVANQDTLYATGKGARQSYKNCHIEGTTDFIFGQASATFESCIIHSKKNSYITAASTAQESDTGFVFLNCVLTARADVLNVYLGRPWRDFAKTVFIECEMGNHINADGWHNWFRPEAEKTAFYAEYNSRGPGANVEKRVFMVTSAYKIAGEKILEKRLTGRMTAA